MYVKVFRSIFDGSLYGKFEATIVFLAMLVIADKDGIVDMTAEKLAAECGYPIDIVLKGLDELQKPDEKSRTPDNDGRRITILHESGWGWEIVNYTKYREIRSAEERREYFKLKKREQRKLSKDVHNVHQSPPAVQPVHPSEADSDSDSEATQSKSALRASRATRLPDDWGLTPERRQMAEAERIDPDRTFAKFTDYWRATAGAKGRKVDWDATWRNWCRNESDRGGGNGVNGKHHVPFPLTSAQLQAEAEARGDTSSPWELLK